MNGWRKSRHSFSSGNCVEVGQGASIIGVRDSKDREAGPVLAFDVQAWAGFTAALKAS